MNNLRIVECFGHIEKELILYIYNEFNLIDEKHILFPKDFKYSYHNYISFRKQTVKKYKQIYNKQYYRKQKFNKILNNER